jgi:hypothetical protein
MRRNDLWMLRESDFDADELGLAQNQIWGDSFDIAQKMR